MINQIDIQLPETTTNLTNSEQPAIKPAQKDMVKREVDETGFVRFEHTLPIPLENGVTTVIFKNEKDKFQTDDPTIAVIDKDIRSIINYANENLGLNVSEDLLSTDPIWSEQKRDIVEGLIASSIYDKEGKRKTRDDAEGPALLLNWLTNRESNPEIGKEAFDELVSRKDILFTDNRNENSLVDENLMLGEIPLDKIFVSNTTDFLPVISQSSVMILTRSDSDGFPRTTIHTTVNGMVMEENEIMDVNSWEGKKYLILMPLEDTIRQNGLPENFTRHDTFWSIEPGSGMRIPEGSSLFVPLSEQESADKFRDVGMNVVYYDREKNNLRESLKKYFVENNIPYIEKVPQHSYSELDIQFADAMGVPATSHIDSRKFSDAEHLFRSAKSAIIQGEVLQNEQGKMTFEEASQIAVSGEQFLNDQNKSKKTALSRAYENIRSKIIEMYLAGSIKKESLVAAYIAKLL